MLGMLEGGGEGAGVGTERPAPGQHRRRTLRRHMPSVCLTRRLSCARPLALSGSPCLQGRLQAACQQAHDADALR